ncbi:MAG: DUF2071 domain-containing protein [Planctomycetales bacterium]
MRAHFEQVLVLTYAYPPHVLARLVPPGLVLDTFDQWAFLAVAMVQTRGLRPVFVPRWLGRSFFLAGYRVFVKHRDRQGRVRRGLRILRSDTDRGTMAFFGNLLTHYNYRRVSACVGEAHGLLDVVVESPDGTGDLHVIADLASRPAPLPEGSPFRDARQARRFAGPLAYTFDYEPETKSIIRIQASRERWRPQPVRVEVRQNTFLQTSPLCQAEPLLAAAFHAQDIDYRWERGVREALQSGNSEVAKMPTDHLQ